jgi:hypothetical protein
MKSDTEHLLEDVFQESVPPDFRAAVLAATLQQVRQQRAARRRRNVLVTTTAALMLLTAVWRSHQPAPTTRLTEAAPAGPARLVQVSSLALPANMIVESGPADVAIVFSGRMIAKVVESSGQKDFQEIDDPELLSLLADRPVALVRPNGQPPQLVFLNPAAEADLPLQ